MNFLKKLFGKQTTKTHADNGPMPTRPLNFRFTVAPENGIKFAQQFVDAVGQNDKKELDYSTQHLDFVDQFLQTFSDEGLSVNDFAETIFVAGCYVGEIMIRNNEGSWVRQEEAGLPEGVSMMPIVVKLPNGNTVDPIAKAFKRFYYGDIENIQYFYQVFTADQKSGEYE